LEGQNLKQSPSSQVLESAKHDSNGPANPFKEKYQDKHNPLARIEQEKLLQRHKKQLGEIKAKPSRVSLSMRYKEKDMGPSQR